MGTTVEAVEPVQNTLVLTPEQLNVGMKVIIHTSTGAPFLVGAGMEIKALQLPFVVAVALAGGRFMIDTRTTTLMELSPAMCAALEGKGEP